MKRAWGLIGIVCLLASVSSVVGQDQSGGGEIHTVDCSSETVAAVMSQVQPGDTIRITGTCNESVVVSKDDITLDGGGSAVIDGSGDWAGILVSGRQNVNIKGLTVQNGRRGGITVTFGAHLVAENVTVRDNDLHGIEVFANSSIWLLTSLIEDNGADGIIALAHSSVHIYDTDVTGNNNQGIGVYNHSHLSSWEHADGGLGSSLVGPRVTDNGGYGVQLSNGSSAVLNNVTTITGNTNDDVAAWFGSRFSIRQSTIGIVSCNGRSVLATTHVVSCP